MISSPSVHGGAGPRTVVFKGKIAQLQASGKPDSLNLE
jgi:hypothetical protein